MNKLAIVTLVLKALLELIAPVAKSHHV